MVAGRPFESEYSRFVADDRAGVFWFARGGPPEGIPRRFAGRRAARSRRALPASSREGDGGCGRAVRDTRAAAQARDAAAEPAGFPGGCGLRSRRNGQTGGGEEEMIDDKNST